MVKDIAPGAASSMLDYAPGFVANHELFFVASDVGGTTLWMSDGTDAGTRMVDPTKPFIDSNTNFEAANGRLFLTANSGAGRELHAVDLLPLLGTKWCKNAEQPLQDFGTITSRFRLPAGATLASLNASVDLGHTWIGDVVISLSHTDSGKTATLLDRPGFPATSNGCSGKLLDVLFTDSARVSAETSCGALARPAYPRDSSVQPASALSTFAGDNLGGEWVLTVTDAAKVDTGTLHDWCLYFNDTIFADGFD
jgi:ELWxxDGT repeat protein